MKITEFSSNGLLSFKYKNTVFMVRLQIHELFKVFKSSNTQEWLRTDTVGLYVFPLVFTRLKFTDVGMINRIGCELKV